MDKKNEIDFKINELFKYIFEINFEILPSEMKNENLLSKSFNFRARDLLTLLLKLEKEFNVEMPEKYIITGKFNTFNNISNLVMEQL